MNVIVSNKQKDIIDNANIDAIKDLNGFFNVGDLIEKFKNYFFSKMILDATSIENFASKDVLKRLADEIGPDRLVILLPETPEPPLDFKKLLIDLKIFNFSNNINDVVKYIDNPNTYEKAMELLNNPEANTDNDGGYVDNSIKSEENEEPVNDNNDNNDSDISNNMEEHNVEETNTVHDSYNRTTASLQDMLNAFNVQSDSSNDNNQYNNNNVTYENMNNDNNMSNNIFSETNNDSNSNFVFLNMNGFDNNSVSNTKRVIGFKNVTLHAGSTSLIYMMMKALLNVLKKDALAIEVNKNEFRLFQNNKMISTTDNEVSNLVSSHSESIILVDLNDCNNFEFCDEVIYLVEPSTIMLNRLMATDQGIFRTLVGEKVILNKSLLRENDIRTLSSEAGIEFMDNIPPVNDRMNNDIILNFISKLGIK